MPTIELTPPTGRYLSFTEREEIAVLREQGRGVRSIAQEIGRSPSTVSRELRRNAATRSGQLKYRAGVAQWKAELAARRPKAAKLVVNGRLHDYVQDRVWATAWSRRFGRRSAENYLEETQQAAPAGPGLGDRLESRADIETSPDRLSR
jgi:IS30 family transposase